MKRPSEAVRVAIINLVQSWHCTQVGQSGTGSFVIIPLDRICMSGLTRDPRCFSQDTRRSREISSWPIPVIGSVSLYICVSLCSPNNGTTFKC